MNVVVLDAIKLMKDSFLMLLFDAAPRVADPYDHLSARRTLSSDPNASSRRHPEKVSHLILHGTFVRGRSFRGATTAQVEGRELEIQLVRQGWGRENPALRQVFSMLFYPGASTEQFQWFNELMRVSSNPDNAERIMRLLDEIDVQDLAPKVQAPTLVLHCKDDARIPFAEGRLVASLIPAARFVPLDSKNHIPLEGEPAWKQFLQTVYEFLGVET